MGTHFADALEAVGDPPTPCKIGGHVSVCFSFEDSFEKWATSERTRNLRGSLSVALQTR
jgi:hypothetical protein